MDRFAKHSDRRGEASTRREESETGRSVASHRDCPENFAIREDDKRRFFMHMCHFVYIRTLRTDRVSKRNIGWEYRQASFEWEWEQNVGWMWRLWA